MSERMRDDSGGGPSAAAAFPGATVVTVLDVYDWPAPDALLTFPPHVLADPAAYARAASLTSGDTGQGDTGHGTGGHGDEALAAAARRRASLAVEGYLALRDQ